ncbi:MAG: AmmeMemoRadiSam system protein B [Chloroflexi bacterium]|nr:AmmeMemoRadiSam system protein B [Chloroflexota bacterium]
MKPKLRPLQAHLIQHQGKPYVVLGDPLKLAAETVAVPQQLVPLLELCDGTRDLAGLGIGFELRTGIRLHPSMVEEVISKLDAALLLESPRFAQARESLLCEFQNAPARPPALAGGGYPANPDELSALLKRHLDAVGQSADDTDSLTGLVSPHIDYHRGGAIYAGVWSKAIRVAQEAELAIVFGTNHMGGYNLFALTHQNYSTPWGVLPTARDIVDQIDRALGQGISFEDELFHRNEHSIELALVWLHHLLGNRRCEIVPILCGSFERFIAGNAAPGHDREISVVLECLREAMKSRRTLVVAAADLAHMGPAFGDSLPIDEIGRAKITAADDELMKAMCASDAEGFFTQIKRERDRRRICGMAPIYMTLRLLSDARGEVTGYMHCPADEMNGSLVSICGVELKQNREAEHVQA